MNRGILKKNQWKSIRKWIIAVLIVEILMLFLNRYLPVLYLTVSILFLGGLCLRLLRIYPGKAEPLILDASAALIALAYAGVSVALETANLRFLLVLTSSVIILPHLAYIFSGRDI